MKINEFLLDRIAEDELLTSGLVNTYESYVASLRSDRITQLALAPWLGRFDPARVLAECKSKRRIIERVSDVKWGGYAVRDVVLGELASVYAGHPDYDQTWVTK